MEATITAWNWCEMGSEATKKKIRKRKNSDSEERAPPPVRTLKQYTVEEKLEIIEFAKNSGNRAAGREYNVAESSIREWRKNENKLRGTDPERSRLTGGGRKNVNVSKTLEDIEKNMRIIEVPLSLSMSSPSIDPSAPENPPTTENEASHDSTNISPHSSSPTLSASGSPNGSVSSGSGRRKAKKPRKVVCE